MKKQSHVSRYERRGWAYRSASCPSWWVRTEIGKVLARTPFYWAELRSCPEGPSPASLFGYAMNPTIYKLPASVPVCNLGAVYRACSGARGERQPWDPPSLLFLSDFHDS